MLRRSLDVLGLSLGVLGLSRGVLGLNLGVLGLNLDVLGLNLDVLGSPKTCKNPVKPTKNRYFCKSGRLARLTAFGTSNLRPLGHP